MKALGQREPGAQRGRREQEQRQCEAMDEAGERQPDSDKVGGARTQRGAGGEAHGSGFRQRGRRA